MTNNFAIHARSSYFERDWQWVFTHDSGRYSGLWVQDLITNGGADRYLFDFMVVAFKIGMVR